MEFEFILEDTKAKLHSVLRQFSNKAIRVAYSGGSDSDTVMCLLRECGYSVRGVLYNTGIEWQATLQHVEYMRSLGHEIDVVRAVRPVPTSNKQFGHPFISKRVSDYLERMQQHGFDFQKDGPLAFAVLYAKYPKMKAALRWWCNEFGGTGRFNIKQNRWLKEFLIEYGLPFRVSGKCCDGAKKLPIKVYAKENAIDLMILGIRRAEGGVRTSAYKSCYFPSGKYTYAMYFPLFWWTTATKAWYDSSRSVIHSACYTEYGLKRTGCAGCPFGQNLNEELIQIEEHEPRLAKGIQSIFAPTYEWTNKYREYQKQKTDGVLD